MSVATAAPQPERAREVRIGWVPAAFGTVGAAYALATIGGAATLAVSPSLALTTLVVVPEAAIGLTVATAALLLLIGGLGVATLIRVRRLQPGTRGRGRLLVAAISALAHVLCYGPAFALFASALSAPLTSPLFGGVDPTEVLLALPDSTDVVFPALVLVAAASLLALTAALAGSWFLAPARVRRAFWMGADALLLLAFVAVTALLPMRPLSDAPDAIALPALRLGVTVFFAVRALARLMPPGLNLLESLGFRPLIATRLLRARKSNFLTTIGLLSILAVTVSSCALTTTLSVMGGFRQDLKRKILGNTAHVVVDREHATFDAWEDAVRIARAAEGVVGASPYVSGEVMVTSASNLAGGILRGIDPASVDAVIDLRSNLVRGRMEYLEDPERLLDLPADETTGTAPYPVRTLRVQEGGSAPPPEGDGGGALREIDRLLEALPGPDDPEGIDRFLRGPEPVAPPREVLPGIIVGQELARALRLYVGDEVNVVSPLGDLGPAGPMPRSRPFRVAGIFYSGMYEYDMKHLYVTLPTAQRFLSAGEEISGIEIKVRDVDRAPAVAEAIRAGIGRSELRVQDWQERNRNLFGALELEKLAMFIVLGIAILVAGFCILGTLILMVQEKSKEVGILKALGTRDPQVVAIFMLEGLLIGVSGAASGLGLGFVACFVLEHFGYPMNPEVYYIDKLPVHVDPWEFLLVGVAALGVSLVATIFPAILASRTGPVEALRYE